MSRNETNRKYREATEDASENFGRATNGAANAVRDSSWSAIEGLREYNEKLVEMTQNNINMTLDFFLRTARAKLPTEFLTVATEHARRQYETSTEQARELAALIQSLTLSAAKPMAEHASRISEKAN